MLPTDTAIKKAKAGAAPVKLSDGKACTFSLHPTLYFSATASSPFPSPAIPTVLSDATLVSVCGLWPRWYDHCETTGDCVDHWLPES